MLEKKTNNNLVLTSRQGKIISQSPFGEIYHFYQDSNDTPKIDEFINRDKGRKVVVIQGLGFVGTAMLAAVANAKGKRNSPLYTVIGVDLPLPSSYWKIGRINEGKLPLKSSDGYMSAIFQDCIRAE